MFNLLVHSQIFSLTPRTYVVYTRIVFTSRYKKNLSLLENKLKIYYYYYSRWDSNTSTLELRLV